MPDPTTPLDLEAIRERLARWESGDETFDVDIWTAFGDIGDLLAALAEAQREQDEARAALDGDKFLAVLKTDWHAFQADYHAARTDAFRMRPVVEAARQWLHNMGYAGLAPAVRTYETQTGGTE